MAHKHTRYEILLINAKYTSATHFHHLLNHNFSIQLIYACEMTTKEKNLLTFSLICIQMNNFDESTNFSFSRISHFSLTTKITQLFWHRHFCYVNKWYREKDQKKDFLLRLNIPRRSTKKLLFIWQIISTNLNETFSWICEVRGQTFFVIFL